MPTILQINTIVNYGSTGRIAEEIGCLSIKRGDESYIAYGRNERHSRSKLIKIGTDLDIKLHGLQTRLFDKHGFGSRKATEKLIDQIKQIDPDIIHLHNIHGYYINIEVLFTYLSKVNIPIVWTLHDSWPLTGHCTNFEVAHCDKWKSLCYSCPEKRKYPGSLFIDRSKKNYLMKKELFTSVENLNIVTVSKWLEGFVKSSFLSHYPVRTINNGIDVNVFSNKGGFEMREKLNLNDSFILLGVASNWKLKKGFEDFIALSKIVPDDYRIILVGLDYNEIKRLPSNVLGFKRTENLEQLVGIYSAADIYVNPTWEDNFPTTNIEALACGTPVITYKTGGSVEAITPETGFVVEQGDFRGILYAAELIRAKGKDHYNETCRKRAFECFNKDDRYNEYMNLYDEILDRKKL